MSTTTISYEYSYSFPINRSTSTFSNIPGTPINIEIISTPSISFALSPSEIYDTKWQSKLRFDVSIKNDSLSVINNFNIKLITSDNLTYISGTLVNSDTGMYYPSTDWRNIYSVTESLAPGKTLNLNYYLMPMPNNNQESYILNPLSVQNRTETPSIQTSNTSYVNLSEQKIVINKNPDGSLLFIENRGTIYSSTFIYRYEPPLNLIFSGAFLLGVPFLDISFYKLGGNYIFKIGPLPPGTPNTPKPLTLMFS